MRKIFLLIIACILICAGACRWGGVKWESAKEKAIEQVYKSVCSCMMPYIRTEKMELKNQVCQDMGTILNPAIASYRDSEEIRLKKSSEVGQGDEEITSEVDDSRLVQEEVVDATQSTQTEELPATETVSPNVSSDKMVKQKEISRMKLQEFDYLRQNFYQVDNTTTIDKDLLDVNKLLGADLKIKKEGEEPKILIYHTHSQEAYANSTPGDESTSVVALGDRLKALLEEKYGISVLHHKGKYDVEKRDSAYANALPEIEQILKENPSIEVVIDLHRDGVAQSTHLVTDINGKPTAQVMFFNGLSRTTAQGELTNLANPYIQDNLAFSFQMQLAAEEYYPGLARRIYLKGYRYNMHLCPKTLLVEVGAQTNSFEEASNAIEPLADILAYVLIEK